MVAVNAIEVAVLVGDMYWTPLPDGSDALPDETAVQLVTEHAGVDRVRAIGLLLEHSPARREHRARIVQRIAALVIAGAIDRAAAMNMAIEQTGMPMGWCAAALADAVVEPRRDERGRWTL